MFAPIAVNHVDYRIFALAICSELVVKESGCRCIGSGQQQLSPGKVMLRSS
jgi:hypothetical protein